MGLAGAPALQQAGPGGVAVAQLRRHRRGSLAVAHGRRPGKKAAEKDVLDPPAGASTSYYPGELSPELAGKEEELMEVIPDPANPPESLLDDSDLSYMGASGNYLAASGSGDYDWSAPGGTDWLMDGYGGAAGLAGGAGDAGFFEGLKSTDYSDNLVQEVGEGNSFRREQRERYGAPIMNMANLAHATEEELLMGAEAQALRDDKVAALMSDAMALHHHFFEHATNRYAVAVRFGEIMEEIEQDDWNLPVEGEEQAVPSWCRAAFALEAEYDAVNQKAAEDDVLLSAMEAKYFEDSVQEHVQRQIEISQVIDFGYVPKEEEDEQALESMLQGMLPGAGDEDEFGSDGLANDLLTRAAAKAEEEFLKLSGDALLDDFGGPLGALGGFGDLADDPLLLKRVGGARGDESSGEEEDGPEEEEEGEVVLEDGIDEEGEALDDDEDDDDVGVAALQTGDSSTTAAGAGAGAGAVGAADRRGVPAALGSLGGSSSGIDSLETDPLLGLDLDLLGDL